MKLLLALLVGSVSVAMQDPQESPFLESSDIAGAVILLAGRYDGAALAGHIDGGAELYKEYGFKALTVQQVRLPHGEELLLEFYRMTDSAAAYGVYSVSRHACETGDTVLGVACISPYQILCATGPWFCRIQNGSGSPAARAGARACIEHILRRTGVRRFEPAGVFRNRVFDSLRSNVKLIRGSLGIQNGLPDWSDLMDEVFGYDMQVVNVDSIEGVVADLVFRNGYDAERLAGRFGMQTNKTGVQMTSSDRVRRYAIWLSPLHVRIVESASSATGLAPYFTALVSPER